MSQLLICLLVADDGIKFNLRLCLLVLLLLVFPRPSIAQTLDQTWTATVNGRTVQVNADGTFRIDNIPSADLFGPAGPGSPFDFIGDDCVRLVATRTALGITEWAYSDTFRIVNGATYLVSDLTLSTTPPPVPVQITLEIPSPVLTAVGETRQMSVETLFADGAVSDEGASACAVYRTSNVSVVQIDPGGIVRATGRGSAFVTVTLEGATSVAPILVVPGDPLTSVEGFVEHMGQPVQGAQVTVIPGNFTTITNVNGAFAFDLVPALEGPVSVWADADINGEFLSQTADGLEPVPEGLTDAGILRLGDVVSWAVDASGDWNVPGNWSTNQVPGLGDDVVISRPAGDFLITIPSGTAVSVRSLRCDEQLTISSASLTVAEPFRVNNQFLLAGGMITDSTILPGYLGQDRVGMVVPQTGGGTVQDVVFEGDFEVREGATLNVNSDLILNGNGTLIFNPCCGSGFLVFQGDSTLDGEGTLDMFGGFVYTLAGTLEIGQAMTVRGTGTIGLVGTSFVNRGSVRAEANSRLILEGVGWTNSGEMICRDSGELVLRGDGWINEGSITAEPTADFLEIGGTWTQNGTIDVVGTKVRLLSTFALADLGDFTTSGGIFELGGTLLNAGQVLVVGENGTEWCLAGAGTIQGGRLEHTNSLPLCVRSGTLNQVVVAGDVTILQGSDRALSLLGGTTLDEGLIRMEGVQCAGGCADARLYVQDGLPLSGTGQIVFAGQGINHITATLAASVTLGPGITVLGSGGVLGLAGISFVNQGVIGANGSILTQASPWTNQGTLQGVPSLDFISGGGGGVLLNEGQIIVANSGGVGTLTVNGDIDMAVSSSVRLELGGSNAGVDHDLLSVSGAVDFNGELLLDPFSGFVPADGQPFNVVTYSSRVGMFSTVTDTFPDFDFVVSYDPAVTVTANAVP